MTLNKEGVRYQFKIYDINDNFIKVIQNDQILNDITFSKNINGGLGEITLEVLGRADLDDTYNQQLKLKIYEKDPETNTFSQIFGGLINNVENLYENYEYFRIYGYGYNILFSEKIIEDTTPGVYTFEKTMEGGAFIKYLIDEVNNDFNNILSYGTIASTGIDVTVKFDKNTALDALNEIIKQLDGYYYYINVDGSVDLKTKSSTYDKILVKGRDLYDFYQGRDLDKIKNHYIIEHFLGEYEQEDTTSISKWGRRTETIIDKEIPNEDAAILQATKLLNLTANPIKRTKAIIKSQYIKDNTFLQKWTTLEPGMTVNIRNIDDVNITQNIQIYKMVYYKDDIEIEFEDITSISSSISSMIIEQKKKIAKYQDREFELVDGFVDHFNNDNNFASLTNLVTGGSELKLAVESFNNPADFTLHNITTLDLVATDFASTTNLKFVNNVMYLDFQSKAFDIQFSYTP